MNLPPPSLGLTSRDLAPGDGRSADFDWVGLSVHSPRSAEEPWFAAAYRSLATEFGPQNELEAAAVLARRFAWPTSGRWQMRYEMVVVGHGDAVAAVADHTAVVDRERPDAAVHVHVSHLLVLPPWRRGGLAGWMRALPIATARRLTASTRQDDRDVILVGEAEHAIADRPETVSRLRSFERAGFRKIDPARVRYVQPDFRPPAQIDAAGNSRPVPLSLIVRHVGREDVRVIDGGVVRSLAESIYAVYADDLRPSEMAAAYRALADFPADDVTVDLVAATAT